MKRKPADSAPAFLKFGSAIGVAGDDRRARHTPLVSVAITSRMNPIANNQKA